MPTDRPANTRRTPLLRPFPDNLHPQLAATCRELNERIARLALALNLSLDNEADMDRVMQHQPVSTAPGGVVLGLLAFGQETQRREEQLWTELRGLIVLRHELEKLCADAVGYVATGDILVEVEQKMSQSGFAPGADGMDLDELLGTPDDPTRPPVAD